MNKEDQDMTRDGDQEHTPTTPAINRSMPPIAKLVLLIALWVSVWVWWQTFLNIDFEYNGSTFWLSLATGLILSSPAAIALWIPTSNSYTWRKFRPFFILFFFAIGVGFGKSSHVNSHSA